MNSSDKKELFQSAFLPILFVVIIWFIKISEFYTESSFSNFGVKPRDAFGLVGIIFSPFLHSDFEHLVANSVPILILSVGIFHFYKQIAFKTIGLMWILTGLGVWIMGRSAYHIGASGLIYAFTTFLFFSGILRRFMPLIAISLLVTFLYGSLVWGIFPWEIGISWEGHLMGFLAGIVVAFYYKFEGPQRKKYEWELDDEADEFDDSLGTLSDSYDNIGTIEENENTSKM